jgi:hypothetical protein
MTSNIEKYKFGFSSGSLLLKETEAIFKEIKSSSNFISGDEVVSYRIIPINSETSQKRMLSEVTKRIRSTKNPLFIDLFLKSENKQKLVLLFYFLCKDYRLITDFMLQKVREKWLNLDKEISTLDFASFLNSKIDSNPEIETLSEITRYKLSQVAIKILKDVGMIVNGKLTKLEINESILSEIVKNGDQWFLDVLLLNDHEKNEFL